MPEAEECYVVETSLDGERWRRFGKAWTKPGELLLLHGAPRAVRYRRIDEEAWRMLPERDGDHPMTLVDLEARTRCELWPDGSHIGLPVLLPGGEEGRLLRFAHSDDGLSWTYALEFRGSHAGA